MVVYFDETGFRGHGVIKDLGQLIQTDINRDRGHRYFRVKTL